jgi:choline-sulfatase
VVFLFFHSFQSPIYRDEELMATIAHSLMAAILLLALLPAAGQQSAPSLPDILIVLTDQQRADAMGDAPGLHTPSMNQLAREGVRFNRAYCATPQCSPSRAALLTGRYPHRTGVMGNVAERGTPAGQSPPLDPTIPGLGRLLTNAGYETAYFGKWHLGKDPGLYGFETHQASRGHELAEPVLKFLSARRETGQKRRPLFLMVSWLNPHEIYGIQQSPAVTLRADSSLPKNLVDDLSQKPPPQRIFLEEDQGKPFRAYTRDDWKRYQAFYHDLTERVDAEIGQVVRKTRTDNANTLVVFSSDHGDLGGAHGLPFKGPAMYEELVRVPLVISWPGKVSPAVSNALVSNLDILPTLCEAAGIKPPGDIDGRSLLPILIGKTQISNWRDAVFVEYYGKQDWRVPIRMIRTASWKYVRYLHYGEELYDLAGDPHELRNLASSKEHDAKRKELGARLDRWMTETRDPFQKLTVTDRAGQPLKN